LQTLSLPRSPGPARPRLTCGNRSSTRTVRAWAARTSLMLLAGRTAIHTTSSVSTENSSMVSKPNTPSGHGGAGASSENRIAGFVRAYIDGTGATAISASASQGRKGRMATAAVPRMVTGATKGAASTLASSE